MGQVREIWNKKRSKKTHEEAHAKLGCLPFYGRNENTNAGIEPQDAHKSSHRRAQESHLGTVPSPIRAAARKKGKRVAPTEKVRRSLKYRTEEARLPAQKIGSQTIRGFQTKKSGREGGEQPR